MVSRGLFPGQVPTVVSKTEYYVTAEVACLLVLEGGFANRGSELGNESFAERSLDSGVQCIGRFVGAAQLCGLLSGPSELVYSIPGQSRLFSF